MATTRRKAHVRRTKTGKTEQVREHRMRTKEGRPKKTRGYYLVEAHDDDRSNARLLVFDSDAERQVYAATKAGEYTIPSLLADEAGQGLAEKCFSAWKRGKKYDPNKDVYYALLNDGRLVTFETKEGRDKAVRNRKAKALTPKEGREKTKKHYDEIGKKLKQGLETMVVYIMKDGKPVYLGSGPGPGARATAKKMGWKVCTIEKWKQIKDK